MELSKKRRRWRGPGQIAGRGRAPGLKEVRAGGEAGAGPTMLAAARRTRGQATEDDGCRSETHGWGR